MRCGFLTILATLLLAYGTTRATGQEILLYANQFTTPNLPIENAFCGTDLDLTPVNDHWAGTGTGTGGGGAWAQTFTVETILINGSGNIYTDPEGVGGDFCLGMLSTAENDLAALTLYRDDIPYVNLFMDISPAEVSGCGGPFGTDIPRFRIVAYDSPGGVFSINTPGALLDADTLTGVAPAADPFELHWVTVATSLDVSGSTDGYVTILLDLIQSGYAVFDNIQITASINPIGIEELSLSPMMRVVPDPAMDRISVPGLDVPAEWSIRGMDGRFELTGSDNLEQGIDISALRSGNHVIEMRTQTGIRKARFVKLDR